jgi:ketosteroid isomerase-like protein
MSRENVETVGGVRTPVNVSSKTRRRTLDERIFVRFPVLARAVTLGWSRLPPRSRLRRTLTARIWRSGIEAANRRDFDVVLLAMDPAFEFEMTESLAGGYVPPDLVGVHRGHEGFLHVWQRLFEAWDLKFESEEIIDFGDRLVVAGRVTARGRHSGIALDQPLFQVVTIRRGLFARQQDFIDREEALEAAGLRE